MNDPRQQFHLVRMPAPAFQTIRGVLAEELGSEHAAYVLREMGMSSADAFHDLLEAWVADRDETSRELPDLTDSEFWVRLSEFFAQLGWGNLERSRLHEGVLALDSVDWTESADGQGAHPSCHFTTGLIGELLRRVAGADFAVLEAECRSAGGKRCRFLIGSPPALDAVHREMQSGASYADALGALS